MAKIIATTNGGIIKVGNSIGLHPSCCCTGCDPCQDINNFIDIMSVSAQTPVGNFTADIALLPGNIWQDGNGNIAVMLGCYAQAIVPWLARDFLGGPCGSVGLNGGIRNIAIGGGQCCNSDEIIAAEGAVWSGPLTFPNEVVAGECKCILLSAVGNLVYNGLNPVWIGTTATFQIDVITGC